MYYYMSEQIQRLFVRELRKFWQYHPAYDKTFVDNIQGKYSFKEAPQQGIIVRSSAGNSVSLSPDNFQGTVHSYISLAHVEGYAGLSLEWIREHALPIHRNDGRFPLPPGIYFLDFCDENGTPTDKAFYVDPILDVVADIPLQLDDTTYQLGASAYIPGSLRVYRMPGSVPLVEGTNYLANAETGLITLIAPLEEDDFLSADYRKPGETTGPWPVEKNRALVEPLPGVVLAFGRRIIPGDRMAVVVTANRGLSALEYGGRWEFTMDFDVIARDVHAQREILDLSMMYFLAIARARLSTMGVEIVTISTGGESEEPYDENADDFYYTGNFSIQVQTDWSTHVPLGIVIRRVDPTEPYLTGNSTAPFDQPEYEKLAGVSDEDMSQAALQLQLLAQQGLKPWDPFSTGKFPLSFGAYGTGEMLR